MSTRQLVIRVAETIDGARRDFPGIRLWRRVARRVGFQASSAFSQHHHRDSSHLSKTRGGLLMERPMSIAVADETRTKAHDEKRRLSRIERPMSIAVVDDDEQPAHDDAHRVDTGDADVPQQAMRMPH